MTKMKHHGKFQSTVSNLQWCVVGLDLWSARRLGAFQRGLQGKINHLGQSPTDGHPGPIYTIAFHADPP